MKLNVWQVTASPLLFVVTTRKRAAVHPDAAILTMKDCVVISYDSLLYSSWPEHVGVGRGVDASHIFGCNEDDSHSAPMFIDFAVLYAVCLFVPATVLFQVFHVGVVAVVVLGFFWAVLGGLVGREKGVAYNGAWIGALFGGLGVLLVLALRGDRHECSYCRSLVRAAAEICPYCENSQGDAVAPER